MATRAEEIAKIGNQVSELSDELIDLIHKRGLHPMTGITAMLCAIQTIARVAPNSAALDEVKELMEHSSRELAKTTFEGNREYRLAGRSPTN